MVCRKNEPCGVPEDFEVGITIEYCQMAVKGFVDKNILGSLTPLGMAHSWYFSDSSGAMS